DDAAGIKPERAADRFAQRARVAIGVVGQVLTDGVIGGHRLWARPERRFVRGQLEHAGDPWGLALAPHVGIDGEHAGTRLRTLQDGHFTLRGHRPVGSRRAPSAGTPKRGAWLPTRARARTQAPALMSTSVTRSMLPPSGTDMSSAAPSKARSGPAITSARGPMACVAAVLQPATRTLHTSTSLTMASAAARETTNTGTPAGWSARSTNGSRATIFGAESNSSALHQAPAPAMLKAGTNPRSPLEAETAATTLAAPM